MWYYNDAEFGGATLTVNFNITIADNSVTVSGVNGWTYGEQAVIPSATATFGNATVMYSTAADGVYVTDVPVNAGTYFVKAVVAETANYRGAESKPQSFEIAQAQNGFVTALRPQRLDVRRCGGSGNSSHHELRRTYRKLLHR